MRRRWPLTRVQAVRPTASAGAALLLLAALSPNSSGVARAASAPLSLAGRSGTTFTVRIAAGTVLSNVGADTPTKASDGSWSGVAIVAPTNDELRRPAQLYQAVAWPESWRCPGSACRWTVAPPPVVGSSATGGLRAGIYKVVLLGAAGARVTVALRPRAGGIRLVNGAATRFTRLTTRVVAGQGVPGREFVLHSFASLPAGSGWGLAVGYNLMAVAPFGASAIQRCVTAGPTNTVLASEGGVFPCADASGEDYLFTPDAGTIGPSGYAPVQGSWAFVSGRHDDAPLGVGLDQAVLATSSYLRFLFVGYSLPT
jgi:hypothetical protein